MVNFSFPNILLSSCHIFRGSHAGKCFNCPLWIGYRGEGPCKGCWCGVTDMLTNDLKQHMLNLTWEILNQYAQLLSIRHHMVQGVSLCQTSTSSCLIRLFALKLVFLDNDTSLMWIFKLKFVSLVSQEILSWFCLTDIC